LAKTGLISSGLWNFCSCFKVGYLIAEIEWKSLFTLLLSLSVEMHASFSWKFFCEGYRIFDCKCNLVVQYRLTIICLKLWGQYGLCFSLLNSLPQLFYQRTNERKWLELVLWTVKYNL
jgi:hypothetical protein